MANTGFWDSNQNIYLPIDTLTWTDLNTSPYATWDNWTTWYQNLSASTTVEFTSATIDFGSSRSIVPFITLHTQRDGSTSVGSYIANTPAITIEGSANADMSSASSITLTRTSNPDYTTLGAKRYYRITININSGTNSTPQGFAGFDIDLNADTITEEIENVNTSTYDDGSTITRTIPTRQKYTDIIYVGVTPSSTITDTNASGTSATGNYVQLDYVAEGYITESAASITTSSVTVVPLIQLVSTAEQSFTIRLFKPNTGDETDCTIRALVKGLPLVAQDVYGNIVQK